MPGSSCLASSRLRPDFAPGAVPFADLALHPFAEINLSHEHNYVLSPADPPSESPPNLGCFKAYPVPTRKSFSS